MEFKTKRLYKKLANIYGTISKIIVGFLFIYWIFMMFNLFRHLNDIAKEDHNLYHIINFMLILFACFFIGVFFSLLQVKYLKKRDDYKRDINEYRQHRVFMIIIDLVNQHRFKEAITLYDSYMKKGERKDFLYSYIIAGKYHSNDLKTMESGKEDLNNFCNNIKPNSKYL